MRSVPNEKAIGKIQTIKKIDTVLCLDLLKKEKMSVPVTIMKLVSAREKARREKNWGKADELREKIKEKGFSVDDTNEGGRVSRV